MPAPPHPRWLLYGASGFTGTLIAEEAVRRGHRPLLAGRSAQRLAPLADRLGLELVAVGLEDARGLVRALEGLPLVVHAAGPFTHTSEPMLQACLATGTHYLDITGEIPVFENTFRHDAEARSRGIALLSGVGFDVVPTDCLALHVASQVPGAQQLQLAVSSPLQVSAGTALSALRQLTAGGRVRRNGLLQPWPLGKGPARVRFPEGERTVVPAPLGDVVTAWHSTGIPNITACVALPAFAAGALRLTTPLLQRVLSVGLVRHGAERLAQARIHGPSEAARQEGRCFAWACARAEDGRQAQAWLETPEAYAYTARAAVRAVEEVLARAPQGALSPARAFGADFALSVEGTRRLEGLP